MTTYYAVVTWQGDYRTDFLSQNPNQTKEAAIKLAKCIITNDWDNYFYGTEHQHASPEAYFKTHEPEEALAILDWTIVPISEEAYTYLSEADNSQTPYATLPKELEDFHAH